ncbi:MAG: molybdenum cofactor guanylyltransferase [Bacillota bacterium]
MEVGLIVLAGGKSSRMGKDKAFLQFSNGTMPEIIVKKAKEYGFKEILLVTNTKERVVLEDATIIEDYYKGMGPLAGIHAGLINSFFEFNFVIPCDMPFISFNLVEEMLPLTEKCQKVVPKMGTKYQPLAAIYSKKCLSQIEFLLENNITKVIELYSLVNTCFFTTDFNESIFFNINTPEDFNKAKEYQEGGIELWRR